MIPKKYRRTIIVNGDEWEYCIRGCCNVFIKNQRTKEEIKWWQEWKSKWKESLTPKDIKEIIEKKELAGTKAICS